MAAQPRVNDPEFNVPDTRGGNLHTTSKVVTPHVTSTKQRPEKPPLTPLKVMLQLVAAVVVAALVLTWYGWQAKRGALARQELQAALPLMERADIASLRQAERHYLAVLDLDRNNGAAIAGLAELNAMLSFLHGVNDAQSKAQTYAAAITEKMSGPSPVVARVLLSLLAGRLDEAHAVMNKVAKPEQLAPRLLWVQAEMELAKGNATAARTLLLQAVDRQTTAPHYVQRLGDVFDLLGEYSRAAQAWAIASQVNPGFMRGVAKNLGTRISRGEPKDGLLATLKTWRDIPEADVGPLGRQAVYWAQATLFFRLGHNKEALAILERAATEDRVLPETLALKGHILLSQGNTQTGLAALLAARKEAHHGENYLYDVSEAYVLAKQPAKALELLLSEREAFQKEARFHTALGNVYLAQQQFGAAKSAFDEALALVADDPEALLGKGRMYGAQRQVQAALQAFLEAASVRSKFPEVYEELGLLGIGVNVEEANARLILAETIFRASSTPVWRMLRFYKTVREALQPKTGAARFIRDWQGREQAYREGVSS